jgi:hypothetical protein
MQLNQRTQLENTEIAGLGRGLQRKLAYSFLLLAFCVSITDVFRLMRTPVEAVPSQTHMTHHTRKF